MAGLALLYQVTLCVFGLLSLEVKGKRVDYGLMRRGCVGSIYGATYTYSYSYGSVHVRLGLLTRLASYTGI